MRPVMLLERFSTHTELLTNKSLVILSITSGGQPVEFSKDYKPDPEYMRCYGQYYRVEVICMPIEIKTNLGDYKFD